MNERVRQRRMERIEKRNAELRRAYRSGLQAGRKESGRGFFTLGFFYGGMVGIGLLALVQWVLGR